jgi:uroporphyrinogen-III synthase
MSDMRLLVTRPEPDGERTAALLRARGHDVMVLPLLRIEAAGQARFGPGPWAAVLLTSANAARAIASHRRHKELVGLPAYTVGARTHTAAMAAGFAPVLSADGDVDDLIALVAAQPPAANLPLLYLAGSDRSGDLAGVVQSRGLQVETAVIYRSVMVADLRPDVRAELAGGRIDAVLHYSARSATAFVAAALSAGIKDSIIRIKQLCLSPQVAAPLLDAGAEAVTVASEPSETALFECIGRP